MKLHSPPALRAVRRRSAPWPRSTMPTKKPSGWRRASAPSGLPSSVATVRVSAPGTKARTTKPLPAGWRPSRPNGLSWVPETSAAISPSPSCQPEFVPAGIMPGSGSRYAPDFLRVLGDGAVGGEPCDVGRIPDCHRLPLGRFFPDAVNPPLRGEVIGEVGRDQKPVGGHQIIDQIPVAAAVVGGEQTRGNRIDGLLQLGVAGDDRTRIVADPPALGDLLGGEAEDDDVVGADAVANLDVGAVERADGHRPVQRQL